MPYEKHEWNNYQKLMDDLWEAGYRPSRATRKNKDNTPLAIPQETLGRKFDEILHDNLWDLLVKDGDAR